MLKHSYIPVHLWLIIDKHVPLSWVTCEEFIKFWIVSYVYNFHFIVSPPVNYSFVWAIFGYYKSPWIPVGSVRKWHQLTRQQDRKICVHVVYAEKSIVVISTDSPDTVWVRDGHVVLEGCYQLFINCTLNSSCGQLKESTFIEGMQNFLWGVKQFRLCEKRRQFFLFGLEWRLILWRTSLNLCVFWETFQTV